MKVFTQTLHKKTLKTFIWTRINPPYPPFSKGGQGGFGDRRK
jgi:hypothetical protein